MVDALDLIENVKSRHISVETMQTICLYKSRHHLSDRTLPQCLYITTAKLLLTQVSSPYKNVICKDLMIQTLDDHILPFH